MKAVFKIAVSSICPLGWLVEHVSGDDNARLWDAAECRAQALPVGVYRCEIELADGLSRAKTEVWE